MPDPSIDTPSDTHEYASLHLPESYPHPVSKVDLRETHISRVFLAGDYVYKLKKPVRLDFLDFSTLERRQHFCREEVRLNQRLAPTAYLEVVPLRQSEAGGYSFCGDGAVVDYAVRMRRLPDDRQLGELLIRSEEEAKTCVEKVAETLASFHQSAESNAKTAAYGRFEVVAQHTRENFVHTRSLRDDGIPSRLFDRCQALVEDELERLQPIIERRAAEGRCCDAHGDLRLDHVYLLEGSKIAVIDCIEFGDSFRFGDPISDLAFLVMDLRFVGRRDLAEQLVHRYGQAGNDPGLSELLPFYVAYRAGVRAKIETIRRSQSTDPQDRTLCTQRANAYLLLILEQLATPSDRPALVLTCGLPGSGKSTLARGVADQAGFHVLRSDVVRDELFPRGEGSDGFGDGRYSPQNVARVYAECRDRARTQLREGQRVIVDATFNAVEQRQAMLELTHELAVPLVVFECGTADQVAHERIRARREDASEADTDTHESMRATWQAPSKELVPHWHRVTTDGSREESCRQAIEVLERLGLYGRTHPDS